MRHVRSALACLILAGCGSSSPPSTTAPPAPAPPSVATGAKAPEGDLVTAHVTELNSDKYARPPSTFRTGSVTAIPPPKATKTATGFQVQFASHASIVTPTVYDRRVIVSGGFQSTLLYAYDATTGAPVWGLDLHDDGPSSPACDRGTCVVSTESCTIFAVDAKTGKHLWSYWLGDPLTSAPTIAGDRVFASYPASSVDATDGKPRPPGVTHALAAFDLRSGKILWQMWLEGDVMSAPVAMGEFVYLTTFGGTVIKAEQATGKIRYAMKARATSAPVVQFANGVEQMYYTRRAEDEAPAPSPDGANPAPKPKAMEMIIRADHNDPKTVYEANRREADYVDGDAQEDSDYAKKSKSQDAGNAANYAFANVGVGSVSSMQGFQGSRIVHIGDRNVNTMGDEVLATDVGTGKTLWSYKLAGNTRSQGGSLGTAPLSAGKSVLFGTLAGEVVRLETASGKKTQTFTVGSPVRSQPVVDGGWIYVGTEDGRLVAIDTKDPTVTGWPTWGGNAQRTGIANALKK
jgi:outer membrane protein assembly factor BamB